MKPVSIKINLLSYFTLLLMLVALVVIGLQYYFSLKLANNAAEDNFRQIAEKTGLYIEQQNNQLLQILRITSTRKKILSADVLAEQPIAMNNLISILRNNPNLYSAYIGQTDGDFYQLINPQLSPLIREKFKTDENTRWILTRISRSSEGRIRTIDMLNSNLESVETRTEKTDYDPRKRPWYMLAQQTREPVTTETYRFSSIDSTGITFA